MPNQTTPPLEDLIENLKTLSEEDRLILFAQMLQKQTKLEAELDWMRDQLTQIMDALERWETSEEPPAELTDSDLKEIDTQLAELYNRTDKLMTKLNPLLPPEKRISPKSQGATSPSA